MRSIISYACPLFSITNQSLLCAESMHHAHIYISCYLSGFLAFGAIKVDFAFVAIFRKECFLDCAISVSIRNIREEM